VSALANLQPDDDIQGTTVNCVGGEPRLACCVCDNHQQAINARAAPRFLLQPMQYSPAHFSKTGYLLLTFIQPEVQFIYQQQQHFLLSIKFITFKHFYYWNI